MQDKLVKLCGLYENTSKTTGKRYFVGNLSFTSKLLILRNDAAAVAGVGQIKDRQRVQNVKQI